jgi:hypothetical protein
VLLLTGGFDTSHKEHAGLLNHQSFVRQKIHLMRNIHQLTPFNLRVPFCQPI